MFFEAGVMIHSGFCASNEPKFELARYLGECRDNEENLRSMFSEILVGTAVKASETGAKQTSGGRLLCADRSGTETQQPDAAGSVLRGLGAHEVRWTSALRRPERSGDFPNKQGFRGTKSQAQLFNINSINLIISEVYVMILSERRCSLYA